MYYNFNKLYILCLRNDENIDIDFCNKNISIEKLSKYTNKLTLVKGNMKMINSIIHRRFINIVDNSYLNIFNHKNYDLDENELIIFMLNIVEEDIKLYLKQYNGMFDIKDVFKLKNINDYYCENKMVKFYLTKIINNISETDYWKRYYNCKLNLSLKFMNRGFLYYDTILNNNIKKILSEINKESLEEDKYLGFLFNKKKWIDVSDAIKKSGFSLYKITKPKYNLNNEIFNNCIDNVKSVREFYNIITSILISKDYCHLVINNKYILDKISDVDFYSNLVNFNKEKKVNINQSFLERFILIFKYIFSYTWITLLTEESIKYSNIKSFDRFIFDIDVASKLFNYPFNINYPKSSPYLPLLISDKLLNAKENLLCFGFNKNNFSINNSSNIVNLDTFKKRLNIFLTGNASINILEGIDWEKIYLCGSMTTATIPKINPLMYLFSENPSNINNLEYNNFINEYYKDSDCDVMSNEQNIYKFIDDAYKFYNKINENIIKIKENKESNLNLEPIKSAVLVINENFIIKYILKK